MERRPHRLAGAALAAVALVAVAGLVLWLPPLSLPNPFAEERRERPDAVALAQIVEQSRYVAASGEFQTVIDVERDTSWIPEFLHGERSLFVAEGDVEASVDFRGLTEDAIVVSPDGKRATIHVPPPQLSRPRLDPDETHLVSRDRGLVDRVADALGNGGGADQQQLYQRAEEKIGTAADQSDLKARARRNTEQFLRSLVQGLGYEHVEVVFDGPDPAAAG